MMSHISLWLDWVLVLIIFKSVNIMKKLILFVKIILSIQNSIVNVFPAKFLHGGKSSSTVYRHS